MNSSVEDNLKVLRLIQRSSIETDRQGEIRKDTQSALAKPDSLVDREQLAKEVMTLLKRELREERQRRGLS